LAYDVALVEYAGNWEAQRKLGEAYDIVSDPQKLAMHRGFPAQGPGQRKHGRFPKLAVQTAFQTEVASKTRNPEVAGPVLPSGHALPHPPSSISELTRKLLEIRIEFLKHHYLNGEERP